MWQARMHKRKPSGGKKRIARKKRRRELGRQAIWVRIGEEEKRKVIRVMGGGKKVKLIACKYANVVDPTTGEVKRAEILELVRNPAGKEFERAKIVTKGAIIKTALGIARVTSRPGQEGIINAVLIKEK